jgi:hypothetical protein
MGAKHTSSSARRKAARVVLNNSLTRQMHTQMATCASMCIHVGGANVLQAADDVKDVNEVRCKIMGSVLRDGSITAVFEQKGKVTYSHQQHTCAETRYEFIETLVVDA